MPLETLNRMRRQLRRPAAKRDSAAAGAAALGCRREGGRPAPEAAEIRQSELDRTDLELIQIVLSEPETIKWLLPRLSPSALKDAPLREILQVCFDLAKRRGSPSYENLMVRLDDPAIRSLAASLIAESALSTPDPGESFRTACTFVRLPGVSGSTRSCSCWTSASGRLASRS